MFVSDCQLCKGVCICSSSMQGNRIFDESLTSLVIPELNRFLELQFICIHLGIETVLLFEYASQATSPGVDCAPMRHCLHRVDLRKNVFQMALAERLDGNTLCAS